MKEEFNPTESVTKAVLKKMFSQRHFSVCDFDNIVTMNRLIVPTETQNMIRALHCINYADMEKPLREWLFKTCLSVLDMEGFRLSEIDRRSLNSSIAEFVEVEPTGFRKTLQRLGVG